MRMEQFSHFPCFKKPDTSGSIKQLNPCSAAAAVGKGMWAVDPDCVKQRVRLSRCVLEREAETSVGEKHSFSAPIGRAVGTSCWQQTHRAAEAQGQSSQGHLAAGRRTVESVNRSLKGMSGSKGVYAVWLLLKGKWKHRFWWSQLEWHREKQTVSKPKWCSPDSWVVHTGRLRPTASHWKHCVKSVTT